MRAGIAGRANITTDSQGSTLNSIPSATACKKAEAALQEFQGTAKDLSVTAAGVCRGIPFLSYGPANAVYPLYSVTKPLIAALLAGIAKQKDIFARRISGKIRPAGAARMGAGALPGEFAQSQFRPA